MVVMRDDGCGAVDGCDFIYTPHTRSYNAKSPHIPSTQPTPLLSHPTHLFHPSPATTHTPQSGVALKFHLPAPPTPSPTTPSLHHYLTNHTLALDVWDGESLMWLGTAHVPLQGVLPMHGGGGSGGMGILPMHGSGGMNVGGGLGLHSHSTTRTPNNNNNNNNTCVLTCPIVPATHTTSPHPHAYHTTISPQYAAASISLRLKLTDCSARACDCVRCMSAWYGGAATQGGAGWNGAVVVDRALWLYAPQQQPLVHVEPITGMF